MASGPASIPPHNPLPQVHFCHNAYLTISPQTFIFNLELVLRRTLMPAVYAAGSFVFSTMPPFKMYEIEFTCRSYHRGFGQNLKTSRK
jgi:hypothetical protein